MTLADHAITAEQVKLLIREGEGLTVELKERYTPRIDEDIVAFANAKGGTLLLGVRDDGIVVGERLTNDLKAKINSLTRNCKPTIATEFSQVGEVVAVVVPEGAEKPYSCGAGYYRRLDGNTQTMKEAMVAAGLREPAFGADAFFRATFQRSLELALKQGKVGSGKRFGEKFGDGWEKSSEKILALLKERNTASAREIAEALGLTSRAVEKQIATLKAAGRLRRVGPAKSGRWEVVK